MQVAPGQSARSVSRSASTSGYGGRLSSVRRDFPGSAHQTPVNGMVHEGRPSYEDLLQEVEGLRSMRQHQPAGSNFDPAVATLFGHNGRALVARDHHAVPLYDPTVINLPWEVKHNLRHGMRHYPRLTSFSLEACREDAAKPLGPRERQQCFVGAGGTLEFSVPPHKAASEESVKTYDEWLGLTIQMTQGLKDDLDLGDGIRGPRAMEYITGVCGHWSRLIRLPRARELFPVIKAYDSGLRQHIYNNGNVGSWDFNLAAWNSHLTEYNLNEAAAAKARAADNDVKFMALQNEFRNYKSQTGKGTTRQRDSTNFQSTAEPRQRKPPTAITPDYICMVCGEKGSHSFGTCPNAAKNTTIELRNGKWYFRAGNEPVCYCFNYPDGCKRQPCRFRHACTQCNATSHGAHAHR
ncbi:hypothetical protein ARMSODRAFT_961274 [Armillaria solidipes]|uniref:Uncharacterized protein n=1 Tax=Armillaria solidipes TaxID=1076256 RepID=A0A2H3B321_9AGAR|nr:hypothetical protein ARMSODRAFT_961274 [Armillaria solidipes]